MPHATSEMAQSTPLTNGTTNGSSKALDRLSKYPAVSDTIETFKSNSYGRKSIEIVDSAYQRFGKPVEGYLETPIQYAKPYVAKADELADSGLGHVESHFPIVKEDTTTIVDKGKSIVFYPFKLAEDGKAYVVSTWQDEYKKTSSHNNRGEGLQTLIFALISTQLKITSDFFQAIADIIGPKYAEGKQTAADYAAAAQEKAGEYTKFGQAKAEELKKKGEEYVKQGQEKGEQVKAEASKKGEELKGKAGAK